MSLSLKFGVISGLFIAVALGATGALADGNHSKTNRFIIGFPEDNMANDWRAAQVRQLARELKKYPNVQFLQADAGGQVARNLEDIDEMVRAGVQLLLLGPRDARLMTTVVAGLRRKGIHIVLLTRRIESEDFDTFISPDDFKIAFTAARYLIRHQGGKGRVLMLEGVPSTTTAKKRAAGFRAALAGSPEMNLVATKVGNYTRAGGIAAIEQALAEGIVFDSIVSHNDAMLIGARLALRAAGIDPRTVPAVGIDYTTEARQAIRDGEQLASSTYPICGIEGAKAAIKILKGESVAKYIEVPAQLVTRENVENIPTIF